MIRVLIVDDEIRLAEAFREQLTEEGMRVFIASQAKEALSIMKRESIDVAVLDIKLPDMDGVELLLKLKHMEPTTEVIMLTGYASVATAIRSMKLGAYDYLTKPCKLTELSNVITKAHEKKMLKVKTIVLEEHLHRMGMRDEFIGKSKEMERVRKLIAMVAGSDIPVLVLGETGTGKELAARAIHDQGPRAGNPFVVVNSSIFQETMLESELFGYKRGAFTGAETDKLGLIEIADRGTFFIDEIGEMGMSIQAKLLRVLETGVFRKLGDTKEIKVDVRFIFATNKDLKEAVEEKRFRKDLFFRISSFIITLPPLRDKREDIPVLINYFIEKFAKGGKKKRLSREAVESMVAYDWPGNIRELSNVIERAIIVSGDREEILASDLSEGLLNPVSRVKEPKESNPTGRVLSLVEMESEYIRAVLHSVGGNKSRAARLLGISRKNLYDKLNASHS
ncbi:MAG: sigma-54-dependent transcriptional regulator [Syntrophorhabdus sp.]